jgi:hypothetical protein
MANERYTCEQIIEALKKSKGMVYLAADLLKCSHQTVYNYIERHPSVRMAWEQEHGVVGDNAELALYSAILAGEHWAISFYLGTKGKDRGYTRRSEQRAENLNVDMAQLTDEQLQRIANGEDPLAVLATSGGGGTGAAETDES